jgi:23S rRNA G2069 N7-methylase RlmK/C1962 C5-methylase RlmI
VCCYNRGFSLTAKVLGGAIHCTGVDSAQDAIDICHENSKLNGLTGADVDFVRDIDNFMKVASDEGKSWDVIILDPPKLAPSVSGLERASRKYHSLNRDAIKLMDPENGGLLLTCTCSAAMTQKDGGQYFLETVQQAAISAGRQVTLLRTSGAASCHTQSPASYPAGAYLTAALFYVAPKSL